jgi:cation:H+ antiporter
MMVYVLALLLGFVLLVWGADKFVIGASATAKKLGVPPLVIGMTVVGFATSAPEIFVSVTAAIQGVAGIAIGNAIGSNIANLGLVLAATALTRPIPVTSETIRRETAFLTGMSGLAFALFVNDDLSRADGLALLTGLGLFLYWTVTLGVRGSGADPLEAEYAAEIPADVALPQAGLWLTVGFIVLLAGANVLVWGGENIARALGVSDLLIGVTIVAIGTSLPELAVGIVSARKGEYGLALGNVIGSNLFNLLAVVGLAATISPMRIDPAVAELHYSVMMMFTVAVLFLAYNYFGKGLSRPAGALLLGGFFAYHGYLVYSNM